MLRRKDLPDYLTYRGNRLAFHRLADGPSLGRLDPYAAGEQVWPMLNGHEIAVTAEEIRDITFQVYGITLPPIDPRDTSALEARIAALERQLTEARPAADPATSPPAEPDAELFDAPPPSSETGADQTSAQDALALRNALAEIERLRAENEALRAPEEASLLPDPDALMRDWGPVGADDEFAGVFPTWLVAEQRDGETVDARIQRLTETFRLRVNELNNLLLAGKIEPEQEEERDRLLKQYDELAKLGDRS